MASTIAETPADASRIVLSKKLEESLEVSKRLLRIAD
jgi:hypothetical protein